MTRSASTVRIVYSLLVLGLCGLSAPRDNEHRVVLEEQGREPFATLTYSLAQNEESLLFMDRVSDRSIHWGDKPITLQGVPGFRFRILVRAAKEPKPDQVQLELAEFSLELIAVEGTTPEMTAALEKHWSPLPNVTCSIVLDSRGALLSSALKLPDGVDPFFRIDVEELIHQVENLIVPVPAEPVGSTGSWNVERPTTELQFEGTQTSHVLLESMTDGGRQFEIEAKRHFIKQTKRPPTNQNRETLLYLDGIESKSVRMTTNHPLPEHTLASGKEAREVENMLGMSVKTETEWKLQAGVMPLDGGDEAWAKKSSLLAKPQTKKE